MNYTVRRHPDVENDILDIAAWISKDSLEAAFRFLEAAEESILELRFMPGRESPKRLRGARLPEVRTRAVRGFPNHLILYDVHPREVYVYAVRHGSRRYHKLLRDRRP